MYVYIHIYNTCTGELQTTQSSFADERMLVFTCPEVRMSHRHSVVRHVAFHVTCAHRLPCCTRCRGMSRVLPPFPSIPVRLPFLNSQIQTNSIHVGARKFRFMHTQIPMYVFIFASQLDDRLTFQSANMAAALPALPPRPSKNRKCANTIKKLGVSVLTQSRNLNDWLGSLRFLQRNLQYNGISIAHVFVLSLPAYRETQIYIYIYIYIYIERERDKDS